MARVAINGAVCHYRLDGDGARPAVIFSNSLGTDLGMWDGQAAVLARHFRLVRYDTRGHGASGSPPGPYSLELLGRDVLALLDHLEIGRAHVVGLSMGGAIAQWLAAHASSRVGRLVLANTAARIGSAEGWRARAAAVRAGGLSEIAASSPGRWFTPAFVARRPEVVAALQQCLRWQDVEGYAACCDALAQADQHSGLPAISADTLVIAGRDDPVTTVADGELLRNGIANARLQVVNASHLSNIEAGTEFTQALLTFLQP